MKACKTAKYRRRHKKEVANRKVKQRLVSAAQLPENKPISAAQKAFGGV